jgi:hypothetical protein
MLRKSCHRTLNNSKITAGGPCIPHPLGWGGRPQFDFLSFDQLSKVKTLYNTKLDEGLLIPLKEKYPALFEVP